MDFRSSSLIGDYAQSLGDAVVRHRSEVAMRAAKVEAELANRTKSEFLANMNHELRTPLNAIIGFSGMLAQADAMDLDAEQVKGYAEYISTSAHKLLSVVNAVLELSAVQAGKIELIRDNVGMSVLIERALKNVEAAAAERDVAIEAVIEEEHDVDIYVDDEKIIKALANVIDNAARFSPEGAQVLVKWRAVDLHWVEITVRDAGAGMTPEEIQQAVTPFQQVSQGLNRKYEGIGLGLSTAKAFVELHGGALKVLSTPGQGTEVTLIVPIDNVRPVKLAATSQRSDRPEAAEPQPPQRSSA
ncbi:MAG: HAMP domain-containing sensor histidine kinase [Pseudomonadota bacterium]